MQHDAQHTDPLGQEYAAFISYRHLPLDAKVAKKVQRAIEGFTLPRGVRATQSERSGQPGHPRGRAMRLGRCFRDEDELAASHSLPERIEEALARSRTLIVICTPAANESAWVQREIEGFIRLHGRERVICVLADGSSSESIPTILRSPDAGKAPDSIPQPSDNPLAADLRPQAKRKHASEMLRIIAAVADRGYDDLQQRQRKRQHRRVAAASAVSVALICIIATLGIWASNASQERLIAESKSLAAEALELYDQGEHLQAIETALRGLPSSGSDSSRPLVPEAQDAFDTVLGLNPDPTRPWVPLFSFDAASTVVDMAHEMEGDWVAILDDTGAITTYSALTGQALAHIAPEVFHLSDGVRPESDWFIEALSPSCLLAGNRTTSGTIACYDPTTGSALWGYARAYPLAASPIRGSDRFDLLTFTDATLAATLLECGTGASISTAMLQFEEAPRYMGAHALCSSDDGTRAYAASDGSIIAFDLTDGTATQTTVEPAPITSIQADGNAVILTAANPASEAGDANDLAFSVSAYDMSGDVPTHLWTLDDAYSATISTKTGAPEAHISYPEVRCILSGAPNAAIVTAGKGLLVVDAASGQVRFSHGFPSSIVSADACFVEGERFAVSVALADGTLDIVSPAAPISANNDMSTTHLPASVDSAMMSASPDGTPLALIRMTDKPDRAFCYAFHPCYDESDIQDYSLDELLGFAREALGANAD